MHVLDRPPRQAKLGVGQRDQPGPAIGLLWSPHSWRSPVERLLTEAVGVFQIEPMHVRPPDHRQVRLAWSAPPQPQPPRDARLARQPLDLHQHQSAPHGGFGAIAAFGWMIVCLGVHASPAADPHRAILRVLLAVLARRCPPGALFGAGEFLAVPLWPSNLRSCRWQRIGIEAAVAPQPHQHGNVLPIEFRQLAGERLRIVAGVEDEQRDWPVGDGRSTSSQICAAATAWVLPPAGTRCTSSGAVQLSWVKLSCASQEYDQPVWIGCPADWREDEK